mmetsp:Transcript_18697/g.58729  ORF Transcript_18697/g.58729 Transcript_18697/m.58729 type:complete len:153 (-) Transcript_18697:131-589(-)
MTTPIVHEGYLQLLDLPSGKQLVVRAGTKEFMTVDSAFSVGTASLHFQNGWAYLVSESGQCKWLTDADMLKFQLYQRVADGRLLRRGLHGPPMWMITLLAKVVKLAVSVSFFAQIVRYSIAKYEVPVYGCKVFWELKYFQDLSGEVFGLDDL